jgi:putative transposase
MRGPKAATLDLTAAEERALETLLRRHSTPQQVALRARIVLAAAAGQSNAEIARRLGVTAETARLWRGRWLGVQPAALADLSAEERLADAPRSGTPAQISAAQVCQIVALACEAPGQSGRPISQWTGREVAAEIVARGILPAISPRHAGRLRKRGTSSRTACATG